MTSVFTVLVLAAFALAGAVEGNLIATKFFAGARNGIREAQGMMRGFATRAHAMKVADAPNNTACQDYTNAIIQQCTSWHDQLQNDNIDWDGFCTNACWTNVSIPANTACLPEDMQKEIALIGVACETKGPNGGRCGPVAMQISEATHCSMYSQDQCVNPERSGIPCAWSDQNGCGPAITNNFLNGVCSPCIIDLLRVVSTFVNTTDRNGGGQDFNLNVDTIAMFQSQLCTQVNGVFCQVAVSAVLGNLTSGQDISNSVLASTCANTTTTTCLLKLLPAIGAVALSDAMSNAQMCAMSFVTQSANDFHNSVAHNCLPCYISMVGQVDSIAAYANNLCSKAASGTYCIALSNFHPSETLQNCYMQAVNGSCGTGCDDAFSGFLNTYGCCFGLFTQVLNSSALVTPTDINNFWAAVNAVRAQYHNMESSSQPIGSFGNNEYDCGHDDSPDLTKIAICPSVSNVAQLMTQTCAYTRAAQKVVKAMHLQLNCTAVLASEDVYNAILSALIADIAQNIGLPVQAITGVVFICPTGAPAAHQFFALTGNPATLQFVIQSDNAAATLAAGAALDTALANGTMTFPTLQSTVTSVCTTCATQADLANLATATALVPTPAPPSPTTSTSDAPTIRAVLTLLAVLVAVIAAV